MFSDIIKQYRTLLLSVIGLLLFLVVIAFLPQEWKDSLKRTLHSKKSTGELAQTADSRSPMTTPPPAPAYVTNPDLKPDALVVTKSLSSLPSDIIKQTALGHILTKDFVFYYLDSEGFLGLKGAIKRIAFEHEETIVDQVLAAALNTPSELAFWKSYDGRLSDFMMSVERNTLTDIMAGLARIAADDKQLSKVGERKINGESVGVYRLWYGMNKNLFIAATENKLFFFSHRDMQLPTAEKVRSWTTKPNDKDPSLANIWDHPVPDAKHLIYLSASYLSFGYQKFFPSLEAIRFQYAEGPGWSSQAMSDGAKIKYSPDGVMTLWGAVPKSPALCFAAPIDDGEVSKLAGAVFKEKKSEATSAVSLVQAPVSVCWFAKSKLYTPLLVARVSAPLSSEFLDYAFEKMIGNFEAGILSEGEMQKRKEQLEKITNGEKISDLVRASKFEDSFPVTKDVQSNGVIYTREVSSRYGLYDANASPNQAKMRSKKYFKVRLAQWKGFLIFSPDDSLVDTTIAVIEKRYPALRDMLPNDSSPILVTDPGEVAALIEQASFDSLPAEQESVFRESVSRRLLPALERMKKYAALGVSIPQSEQRQWQEFSWQNISKN